MLCLTAVTFGCYESALKYMKQLQEVDRRVLCTSSATATAGTQRTITPCHALCGIHLQATKRQHCLSAGQQGLLLRLAAAIAMSWTWEGGPPRSAGVSQPHSNHATVQSMHRSPDTVSEFRSCCMLLECWSSQYCSYKPVLQ
jgi:hypothetical protein